MRQSKNDPFACEESEADEVCAWLVGLDDDAWGVVRGDAWIKRDGGGAGPVLTGDPEIDKLERELWEKTQKAERAKRKGRRDA